MKFIVFAVAVLITPLSAIAAEPVEREVVPASENAALQYWAIWAHYESQDWDRLRLQYVQGVPRDAEPDPLAERLVDITKMKHCDIALDLSLGLDTSLVHVDMMHDVTYILMVDAQVMLQRNRDREAAERVAAAIRICEHRAQIGFPVSSMAAANRLERIAKFIAEYQQQWDESDREILFKALDRFGEKDTLRTVDAARNYARFMRDAHLKEVDGGRLDPKTVRRVMLRESTGVTDLGDGLMGFDEDVLYAELVAPIVREADSDMHARALLKRAILLAERAASELADAWEAPSPEQDEESVRAEIDAGRYGPLAANFIAGVERLRTRSFETAELINALRAWASGETETLELPERNRR